MENKELIELLRERGFQIKTASSTIDSISAEAIIKEFSSQTEAETSPDATTVSPAPTAPVEPTTPSAGPKIPQGAFVRSREDVEREREQREAAEKQAIEAELERKRQERESARQAALEKAREQAQRAAPKSPANPPAPRNAPPAMVPPRPQTGKTPPPSAQPAAQQPAAAPNLPKGILRAPQTEKPAETPAAKAPPPTPAAPPIPRKENVPPPLPSGVVQAPQVKSPATPPNLKGVVQAPTSQQAAPASGITGNESVRIEERDGVRILHVKPPIVVRELATQLEMKPFKLISELMEMGIFASINQAIDEEVAGKLADRHGFVLEVHHRGEDKPAQQASQTKKAPKQDENDPALLETRPPVVCVMGHVDHGKTTLLDTIRKSSVVSGEAGGITQHTAAYQVEHNAHKITFLDTPGHAAFSRMRERGAQVTDIAILVVAADDGFMPQTDEALKFAQKHNVPVVVAINKMDAKGANIDRVKQQMQQRNIAPEDWGGETLCQPISALNAENIDELLEQVLLQAEIMELKANPKASVEGMVIESQMEQGRGTTTTIIVQKGTLKVGSALVCGDKYCKVRSMLNEHGKTVKSAPPSTPVRLLGWSGTPSSGAIFTGAKNEKDARRQAEELAQSLKAEADETPAESLPSNVDELLMAIDAQQKKVFRMVLKSDVHGTVEALEEAFREIGSDKVDLKIIDSGVGMVTKNDVILASSSEANVVCFNVKTENGVNALAKHHNVRLITHNIIYELIDQVTEAMAELLDPEYSEVRIGGAEIRQVFPVSKGFVAGCMVTDGIVKRKAKARISRNEEVVYDGKVSTLRRFKDDVAEVRAGYECGIQLEGFNRYEEGDLIEFFEVHESRPTL